MTTLSAFVVLAALLLVHATRLRRNREATLTIPLERHHASDAIFGTACDKTIQKTA